MIDEKQMVNLTDAARICGLKRQTIYYHMRNGTGPAVVLVGGRPYFDRKAVAEWKRLRDAGGRKA